MPRLIIRTGERAGEALEIEGVMMIGRNPEVEMNLEDPHVARRHARLEIRANRVWLIDHCTVNGTFVNNIAIAEQPLSHGDEIRIGKTLLVFFDN